MRKILLAILVTGCTMLTVGCGEKKVILPAEPVKIQTKTCCECLGNPEDPKCKCFGKTCCGKEFKDCKCVKAKEDVLNEFNTNKCECLYCNCAAKPEQCTCTKLRCKENSCSCNNWKK